MLLHGMLSERLYFRNLTMSDAVVWEGFLNDPGASKFFPPIVDAARFSMEWMERSLKRYENEGYGFYALINRVAGEFIGQCGLLLQDVNGMEELEIAFHIIPQFWNCGYATESAIACRDFVFRNCLRDSVISLIAPENFASQKVAVKTGLQKELEIFWRGQAYLVYRINYDQWQGLKK